MKTICISSRSANTPASAVRKFVPLSDAAKKRGIAVALELLDLALRRYNKN